MYPSVQKFVREKIMSHIFMMQKTNYEELKVGEITTKLIKMPVLMYTYMEHWKNLYIPQAIVFTVAIIYFMVHNWIIGTALFILITSLAYMIYSSIFICEGVSKKRDKIYNNLYEEVDDVLRNAITILNFNQEEYELERINTYHEDYKVLSERSLNCAMRVRYTFLPIILCFLIFFTYFSYKKVIDGKMLPGTFISLFIIMLYIINSMWRMIGNVKEIVLKWGMIKETLEIFNKCTKIKEDNGITYEEPNKMGIIFKDIWYYFEDEKGIRRDIFEGLNLEFNNNEKVLIIGQIGSGKTTILKMMMKYIEPIRGEIFINNISFSKINCNELRRYIGYIPQTPILFNRSIYENITYGVKGYDKYAVITLINQLGLEDIFSQLPAGMDTNVGKYGSKISGGQRQIVWILRTILQNPPIILMDEPTASIDETTKVIVHNLLTVLMKDKTVIMVTHDPFLLKFTNRTIEMKHGKVINVNHRSHH
jgi:ABC-type bacteriocin/lantibiotic exporter with double-glycine peptidase domain